MWESKRKLREKDERIKELEINLDVAEAINKLNDRYCQELIQNLENEKKKRKAECEEWSEKHSALYEKYLNLLERYRKVLEFVTDINVGNKEENDDKQREKLCMLEEKQEKGELWVPSLELCRSLADVQIILSFANTVDPLEPNKIKWRKIINGELFGDSVVLMERDLLFVLPTYLEMFVKQIERIEKEIYSEEKNK